MAINPDTQATEWTSVVPEPEELPSHIQNKLDRKPRARAPSEPSTVDRSADTVRPPTASPKSAEDPKPSSSSEGDVPSVPAAPRVPVI